MVKTVTNWGRNGVADWLTQRLSALILLSYAVVMIGWIAMNPNMDYHQWKNCFSSTPLKIYTLLALLSLTLHAWIGLWSVSTDYITVRLMGNKATLLRLLFQGVCATILVAYVIWGILILWA